MLSQKPNSGCESWEMAGVKKEKKNLENWRQKKKERENQNALRLSMERPEWCKSLRHRVKLLTRVKDLGEDGPRGRLLTSGGWMTGERRTHVIKPGVSIKAECLFIWALGCKGLETARM